MRLFIFLSSSLATESLLVSDAVRGEERREELKERSATVMRQGDDLPNGYMFEMVISPNRCKLLNYLR